MDPVVQTTYGKVRGFMQDGIVNYLGIPYAKPPVGALRYRRAEPMEPWSGVLEANQYGAKSVQFFDGKCQGSEDCLTVNIRCPEGAKDLPVLVFIHGGGYNTGSAADPLIAGDAFVRKDIVYVTFQYRLNVLGFYDFNVYPECADFASNCAVSDHLLAMHWIQENIRAFGGDPDRITIAGESAGGTSVTLLMALPEAKGTFAQVISSSGIHNGVFTPEMQKKHVEMFMEGMGWTTKDLPKLKELDPYAVLQAHEFGAKMHQYRYPGIFLPSPVIDDLLPERIIEAIQGGSAEGIRLMIGCNHDEGTFFVRDKDTNFPNSWEMIASMFVKNGNEHALPRVRQYYEQFGERAFIEFATDYAFRMPAMRVAEAQRGHGPVYLYQFDFAPKKAREIGFGASHAMDLTYEYGEPTKGFGQFLHEGEDPAVIQSVTDAMHGAWVDFVKTGVPSKEWPTYEGYQSPMRIYDRETRTETVDRTELMWVWDGLKFYAD